MGFFAVVATTTASLVVVIFLFLALRRFVPDSGMGRFWAFFAASLLFFTTYAFAAKFFAMIFGLPTK